MRCVWRCGARVRARWLILSFVISPHPFICYIASTCVLSTRHLHEMTNDILALLLAIASTTFNQAIAANPSLAPMGPQLRQMMSSPFFRQMMSNPEMVRSLMQMRGAGGVPGMPGGAGVGGFPAPGSYDAENVQGSAAGAGNPGAAGNPFASLLGGAGAGGGAANPFGMDPAMMQSLLGGMGGGGGGAGGAGFGSGFGGLGGLGAAPAPAAPQDTRPLEERYQSQLLQLNEMGLCDPGQNIRALSMTGGNVNAAIELIFSGRKCTCGCVPRVGADPWIGVPSSS